MVEPYSNGKTRLQNLQNRMNNPLGYQQQDENFQLGNMLGNIGLSAMNGFGKKDNQFAGVDVSQGVGDTDFAKLGNLTNNGTDFSKLGINDPKKMDELTKLFSKANL